MNSEIENCLNSLRERPQDPQVLQSLEEYLASNEMNPDEILQVLVQSREHHRTRGDWEAVVGLINLELPRTAGSEQRVELLSLKGKVLEEELLEEEAALEAFENVLEIQPDHAETKETVEHIRLIRENWEKVADKFIGEAESVADSDRQLSTSLFLSAAEVIWKNSPGDSKVEQYLRRSLEIEPRNRKASGHLERLLRREQRYEELTDIYLQRVDVSDDSEDRVVALLAAADLCAGELSDLERASKLYQRALSLHPTNPKALQHLVATLTAQEDWPGLIRFYKGALRGRPDKAQERQILVEMGTLYWEKMGEMDQAEEYFRRVRRTEAANREMLNFYRRYYRERGEPAKILALLDGALRGVQDPELKLALSREMAEVAEKDVENLEKAIDIWKGIQRLEGRSPAASTALKRLYRQTQPPKWNALRELIKDEIELLDDTHVEEKIALLMEVVEIYRDHLKLDVMVINTYNAILTLQPDHAEALDALTQKYEALGRWNDLIGLLLRRKDAQTDVDDKIQTLHQVVGLWIDKFGNQSQAIGPLREILELDPMEKTALDRLEVIYKKRRNWHELMDLYRMQLPHLEGQRRRGQYKKMAKLAADKLGDPTESIQVWNLVLAEEDSSDEEALAELAKLYRKEERWLPLAEVTHRQVDRVSEDPEATEQIQALLESLGDIYTNRIRAVENAIVVWQRVLEIRPESPKALAVLRELYVQEKHWADLENLHASRGEYSELAETLTNAADRSVDPQLKIQLYTRVGEICRDELEHGDRAMKAFERVLAIDPENTHAALALEPLYRQGEQWGRLLSVYEVLYIKATEPADQMGLIDKIRLLYESHLESKQLAFQWSTRAYAVDPDNARVRSEMERLAAESDSWEELVQIYMDRVQNISDAEIKAELLRHLAFLCSDKLHRPEDAEVFYRDLLEIYPEDLPALEALEQIYAATQRWDGLVDIYNLRAELEKDVDQKLAFLFKVAFIQEERIGDPVLAIQTLTRILEVDPDNLRALKSLARLYEVRGEWFPLVEVLRKELELVEQKEDRVEIFHRLGDILQSKLDALEEGIDALAQALSLDPLHRRTVEVLEQHLIEGGPFRHRVALLLQPFFDRTEDWRKLVQVIEILLESEEDQGVRVAFFKRLMVIQERQFADGDAAFAAGSNILALTPHDREIRQQMTRLAESLGREDELAGLLTDAVHRLSETGADPDLEISMSWELALLLDVQLGQPDEALRHLRRILELRPTHGETFEMLHRILLDNGRYIELRDLLEQRKTLTEEPAAKRDILLQISALNENVLEDIPAAISSFEQILDLEAGHEEAIKSLHRHYTEQQRWQDLLQLLRREMDLVTDEETLSKLKIEQADLLMHHLDDDDAATNLLEEVATSDPEEDRAITLLEEMLERESLKRRATEILEPVYDHRQDFESLVRVLVIRRALVEEEYEVVELLCRVAILLEERLGDPLSALGKYREALMIAPAASVVHDAIRRLTAQLEVWSEAAECWSMALEKVDPEEISLRAKLLGWLAEIYDQRLQDSEMAQKIYQQLLDLDPTNLETAGPAAEALTRIYEQESQWSEMINVLKRQLDWAETQEQRQKLLLKIAGIQEDVLGENQVAVETYRQLLEENAESEEALDSLERLYLQAESWSDLVEIYRRRVELSSSVEDQRARWLQIATIYEEELKDLDQAITAYVTILDQSPQDIGSIRSLARIYRDSNRWTELLEMLERELSLIEEDDEQRVALLFEAGTLQHRNLSEIASAIDRYSEILAIQDHHEGARQALEELLMQKDFLHQVADLLAPMYRDDCNWDSLVRIHELQADTEDPTVKIKNLREVARLCEEGLDDPERAFNAYKNALEVAAGDPDILDLVEHFHRLASSLERWTELLEVLEALVIDVMESRVRVAVHLLCAEICRDRLVNAEGARDHFKQVLDEEPEHTGALGALDALFEALEQWEELLEILNRRVELTTEPGEKRKLILRAAVICRDRLGRPIDAIAAYERAIELHPDDHEVVQALDDLYTTTERWPELARLIQDQLDRMESQVERAASFFRLGQLFAEQLEDHVQALEAYKEVLSIDPGQEDVVKALEGYLEDPDLQAEAARILEPHYVGRQEWVKLIRIYQIRLEVADEPERRLSLSTRIAQLYEEQLEDLDGAFTWYSKVFLEKPSDTQIRDQILRLAGILDCWQEVAEVLATYLDENIDQLDDTARSVALILGNIYDERLYQVDQAVSCYQGILTQDRLDVEAFDLLESLLTRAERWESLLDLYRETAEVAVDVDQRREILLKICRIWEEALDNLPEAIDAHMAVLDLAPDDPESMLALDRLYAETGRWHELCELLSRQAETIDDDEELVELKYRLGTIYELRIEDLPSAIDHYEEVLGRDPSHASTVAALERLILDRDQRFRIAKILEPIYRWTDEWAKLVVIYDAQLDFIEEPEQRRHLLLEIARLHEERAGGSIELAFKAMCRAFEETFGDPDLLRQIERLAESLNNWRDVVAVLQKGVEEVYDNDLLARIHTRIAQLHEERLWDEHGAVDAWKQVLVAKDDSEEAIEALIRLLEGLERFEDLVDILQRKIEVSTDLQEQKETYYRIAEIYETRLINSNRAIDTFRQALALDESDAFSLDSLERLYRMAESWMDLIGIYRQKIDLCEEETQRKALQLSVAKIYDEKLHDNFEAIAAYKTVLEIDSSNAVVLDALDRLFTHEGLNSDLLEVLELKIANEQDEDLKRKMTFRAATLMEREIGDLDGAISRYREVLEGEWSHQQAREALERLVHDETYRGSVAEILERLYTVSEEVKPLVDLLELKLELVVESTDRRDLLMRIGELSEVGLENLQGAFSAFCRAFAEVPEDERAAEEMERLGAQLELMPQVIEIYENKLPDIYDMALGRRVHLKVAEMAERLLGDDPKAEDHYRAVLDNEGDDLETLQALDRVLHRQQKWTDLAEILDREVQLVSEPFDQAELYFRLGTIRMDEHEDMDGSFTAFRDALERDPNHSGAKKALEKLLPNETYRLMVLDVLEPLFEENGDFAKLADMLETRLATVVDPSDRVSLLERIAQIHQDQLGSKDSALGALGRAMAEDPSNEDVLDHLERMAGELNRYGELVALADEILGGELVADAARALGLRTARWYGAKLNDIEKSQRCLNRVLEIDPECVPALDGLEQIHRAAGDDLELTHVLARKAELELDVQEKRHLLVELAKLKEDRLDDIEGAIEAWRTMVESDPGDAEALQALVPLYERTEAWDDLLEVLDQQAQLASEQEDQIDLKHRAGQVLLERMDDPGRAVGIYRDILDLAPDDYSALNALQGIYSAREEWISLQEILMWQLEQRTETERIPLFMQLAELCLEKLDNIDEAVGFYHQILTVDPTHGGALEKLERTLRRSGRWYDLVDLLRKHAETLAEQGDVSGEVKQLVQAARVWTDELDNPEAAGEVLEEILQRDENNVNALAGLARIYESTEQWEKCQDVLERASALGPDPREAAELEYRMGRVILAQTNNEDQAADHYARALELDQGHGEAAVALEELARKQEDWLRVAQVLEVRLELAEPADRLGILCELGAIYSEKLDQAERGVSMLQRARDLEPDNVDVLAALSDGYYAADQLDEAEPLLQRLIELAGTKRRKALAGYEFRLGAIAEKRGDTAAAGERYDKAYKMDSTYAPTLVALGRIYMVQQDWENARRIYRSMLLQNLDERAGITKADVFYNLGQVHAAMGESSKAKSMYERGLEVDGSHEKLREALEELKR